MDYSQFEGADSKSDGWLTRNLERFLVKTQNFQMAAKPLEKAATVTLLCKYHTFFSMYTFYFDRL